MGSTESEKLLRGRLGEELRRARLARGLTQADLAERLDTDPETISRFERGSSLPSLTRLLDLAETLGVTVASLLGRASPRMTDELEDVGRSLLALSEPDQRLAIAVLRTIISERGR